MPQLITLLAQYERVKGIGWAINLLSLIAFTLFLNVPYQFFRLDDMLIAKLFIAMCACISTFIFGFAVNDRCIEARTYHALLQLEPSKKHVVTIMNAQSLIQLPCSQYRALKRYLESF